MYKNKSSLPYNAAGIASTTSESLSMMFADVSATDVIACAAGTSPAVTAAAISFSNPSKELLEPAAVSPCQIQNSVFCATSVLRVQSRNQKTLVVMFDQDHSP